MPRRTAPAHLWLRPAEGDRAAVWCIVEGRRRTSTNCPESAIEAAEVFFAHHIAARRAPALKKQRDPDHIWIADVLSVYLDEVVPGQARPMQAQKRIARLAAFWGRQHLSKINGATCREYTSQRGDGAARRDLEDLRSAVNHHARRGLHQGLITIDLPAKGKSRLRWLSRSEVARLIWACWTYREMQTRHKGKERGQCLPTEKRPLRHLARFILMAAYTGSRQGAILTASIYAGANRSYIDLDSRLFYRLADGAAITNKRQPPVPIPDRLMAHIERWKRRGIIAQYVVEWEGKPVQSIKTAWTRAIKLADLPGVNRHTMRHTAATWLMKARVPDELAAAYLGMSPQIYRATYAHMHPDFMRLAAQAISRR